MDILEHAEPVIRNLDTEKLGKPFVPKRRQIAYCDRAFDQADFDLEPQQNVKIIGHFIRFHPDKRWPNLLDTPNNGCWIEPLQVRKRTDRIRIPSIPRRTASSYLI